MKRLSARPPAARAERPSTAVLHDEANVRVIAFHLLAGQQVPPHHSAGTVLVQVVSGTGTFHGDGAEETLGPGESAVYAPGETHSIVCGDGGALHFLAIISPRPG